MNAVVIIVAAVACLFGGTMADDRVAARSTGSTSSKGSTGGLLSCKPRSATAPLVRFQAVRRDGVEYSRVRVPSERMNFSDVNVANYGSLTFLQCVEAANKNNMDAFSFKNGKCVGYKIGDGICLCSKGDLVLYLATSAIRSTSSTKTFIVAKERAGAAPLPAGYVRKIIYPIISMTGDHFVISSSSCEDVLANLKPRRYRPALLHTANGKCYYTVSFSNFPCTSCPGTATEVIVMEPPANQTHLLSKCGGTIPLQGVNDIEFYAGPKTIEILYSHEGYGCIPYPDPVSDDICNITILSPVGPITTFFNALYNVDIDASSENTCKGDELYLYFGSVDGRICLRKEDTEEELITATDKVIVRFQRKPAYNKNSVNKGFAFVVNYFYD